MKDVQTVFAKLAGVSKSISTLLKQTSEGIYKTLAKTNFEPNEVEKYFMSASTQLSELKKSLPKLYADFEAIDDKPSVKMSEGSGSPYHYGRNQLESLRRDIDQIFEIRANSELAIPPKSCNPTLSPLAELKIASSRT